MMHRNESQPRSSLYLVLRAEALLGSLKFFISETDSLRRRVQFLAQSDFWEWEIDNLIYSFTNLAERQKTWASPSAARQKLAQLDIVLDAKLIHRIGYRYGWNTRRTSDRVAPTDLLRQTIDAWNELIDIVEAHLMKQSKMLSERWNVQTATNLAKLRKQFPPELEVEAGEPIEA